MPQVPGIAWRTWRTTRWLTAGLLGVWLLTTLGAVWFARDLHALRVFGFPAGYWAAAAGALLVYLVIVAVYAVAMDRLEREPLSDAAQDPAPEPPTAVRAS